MFDFAKIRQTITSLAGELKKLREEREALLQKREELEGAPACKEDLLATLDTWIDRRAQDFPEKLKSGVNYYFRHPLVSELGGIQTSAYTCPRAQRPRRILWRC